MRSLVVSTNWSWVEWHWFSECLHSIWLALPSWYRCSDGIDDDSIASSICTGCLSRLSVSNAQCAIIASSSKRMHRLWCTNACMLFAHWCVQFKWVNVMQKNKLRILIRLFVMIYKRHDSLVVCGCCYCDGSFNLNWLRVWICAPLAIP